MTDKEKVIEGLQKIIDDDWIWKHADYYASLISDALAILKKHEVDTSKYQYKYDHTDCIWYHDGRGRCPVTCSQYRDGWNDAMNFIFKNGPGYRPYKRSVRQE